MMIQLSPFRGLAWARASGARSHGSKAQSIPRSTSKLLRLAAVLCACLAIATMFPFMWFHGGVDKPGGGRSGKARTPDTTKSFAAGRAAARARASSSSYPSDFNWRSYLLYHADLRASGIRTAEEAWGHFQTKGKLRLTPRIPVVLRYMACHGLFNQMYAHVAAWVLADMLGADVVMPPSMYRNSYASRYEVLNQDSSNLQWSAAPLGALINVQSLKEDYRARGRSLHEYPETGRLPNCSAPETAFLEDLPEGVSPEQVVQLDEVYLRGATLDDLWDLAADAVVKKHYSLAAEGFPRTATIVLDLPSTFFALMTISCMDHAREAALSLEFNPDVVAIASKIIASISGVGGTRSFNGIHFRVEKDAADWQRLNGGEEAYLAMYLQASRRAGFSPDRDLYIASGLLSYAGHEEMAWLNATLGPLARRLLYKEMFVSAAELASLNTEQLALVDFLVLAGSKVFVGIGSSTFSVYLREYRRLHGHVQRSSNVFVSSKAIGTDVLFQRCSHFSD